MADSELATVPCDIDEVANLPTDQYYIRHQETFAGRNRFEDKSLHPKKVSCPTDSPGPELWELDRLPNGHYRISARGAPTKEIRNLLFALLVEREEAEEWIITMRVQGHRPLYTIQKADGQGWAKQTDMEEPQIAVRHLRSTRSLPPQFEPGALWNIQPLVD